MALETDPGDLERRGWEALSSDPQSATAFYGEVLDDDVRMLFPGGLLLTDREEILRTMGGPPWDAFQLSGLEGVPARTEEHTTELQTRGQLVCRLHHKQQKTIKKQK